MALKTGPQPFIFAGDSTYKLEAESDFSVFTVDDNGELDSFVVRSVDGRAKFRTVGQFAGYVKIPDGVHWSLEESGLGYEEVSPIPVELPEDMKVPETLEDKLKRMLAAMVEERYGRSSEEMESFEESMDFDIDELDPLSGYEVQEMEETFAEEEHPAPPAEPQSTSPEPTGEATATTATPAPAESS